MPNLKHFVRQLPVAGPVAVAVYRALARRQNKPDPFPGSAEYWENRYLGGGTSGAGSYGKFAEFKADILNSFVAENDIKSVIEFGCGDGNQLALANYPQYLGVDVSKTAVDSCRRAFSEDATKSFCELGDYKGQTAELSLSLDVIYHLVEDVVFEGYMQRLFDASTRFVAIYSSNIDEYDARNGSHVRHREFTKWVCDSANSWSLAIHIPNKYPYYGDFKTGSFSDFYIFEQKS